MPIQLGLFPIQLELFPIPAGTLVRDTWLRPDGSTGVLEGRVKLVTNTFIYFQCNEIHCTCRIPVYDRTQSSHAVGVPRPPLF